MKKFLCIVLALLLILPLQNIDTVYANENDFLNEELKSYILIDYNSGETLIESHSEDRFEIASMVKLMTTLLTMENIEKGKFDLQTKFTVSEYAASMEGSEAFLEPNKEYTLDELLKSVIVASANDSSVVLAENIAGTEQNFVKMMNDKAKELGMKNTLYSNATGLPSTLQYSTAKDVSILLKEVAKHDTYYKYSKIWLDKLVHYDGRETELVNTNRLIRQYTGCDIGKTGFTDEAGYCLSASAKRNDMRLISVVMGAKTSKDRFTISEKLLNYGFNNFENKKLIDKTQIIENNIKVNGSKNKEIDLVFEKDYYYLCKKGEDSKLQIKFDLPEEINAPINVGDKMATAYILREGVILEEIKIISKTACDKLNYKESLDLIYENIPNTSNILFENFKEKLKEVSKEKGIIFAIGYLF